MIIEKIEIERARPPAQRPPPAAHPLDLVQPLHQCLRREAGFDLSHGIDEWRLVRHPERRRNKKGRGPLQPEPAFAQTPERFRYRVMRRSPRTVAIASQCDEYHLFLERNWTGV